MMNDLISRQVAIDVVHKSILDFFDICDDDEESPMTYKDERLLELNKAITTQIKAATSADVVEVVRCKDCKYSQPWYGECRCFFWNTIGIGVYGNAYCSYGVRNDDQHQ